MHYVTFLIDMCIDKRNVPSCHKQAGVTPMLHLSIKRAYMYTEIIDQ